MSSDPSAPTSTPTSSSVDPALYSTPDARWTAVRTRDKTAVGAFIYGVKTTGVYCRPDCKARLARRANVEFYADMAEAERAGFRACKRCKPNAPPGQEVDPVLAKIRAAVELVKERAARGQKITLQELSSQVGLSKWHLQRVFTKMKGMSPRAMSNSIMSSIENEQQASASTTRTAARQRSIPPTPAAAESGRSGGTVTRTGTPTIEGAPGTTVGAPLQRESSAHSSSGVGSEYSYPGDTQISPLDMNPNTLRAFSPGCDDPDVDTVLRDLFPELY
jgi:methylphosphotriester-DNA--protein-cysteine methyltransferase